MSDALARKVDRLSSMTLRLVGSMATLRTDVDELRGDLARFKRLTVELREVLATMPRRDTAPGG